MTAYLLMALLVLAASVMLTRPWWQRGTTAHMQRRAANVAAYKTRVDEIETDRATRLLDAESAAELKQELAVRLLDDAQPDSAAVPAASGSRWPALAAACALGVFGGGWYYAAGSWRTDGLIELASQHPEQAQALAVQGMVANLAAKLEKNPDDAEGWAMLGRSYYVLQRYGEAAQAYGKANALLQPGDAGLLVGQAEALAMANERNLQGRPVDLIEAALKLDPGNLKALWFAGIAALQRDDQPAAKKYWLALSAQPLPDDLRAALDEQLQQLGVTPAKPEAASSGLTLQVQVALAPALAGQLDGTQTLFVFAKAESGPPMPLAVQRIVAPRLPLRVTLDDSMAMMPALKLSQFDHWIVTARLTRGGTVQTESGDLQGQVRVSRAQAAQPLQITIDQRVP